MRISYQILLEEMDRAYRTGERSLCEFLIGQAYEGLDTAAESKQEQQSFIASLGDTHLMGGMMSQIFY